MHDERDAVLTRMVCEHQVMLLKLCRMHLKDVLLAEDAVQTTFLKAYAALPSFKGECSEKTWLIRIAVNTCRDMRRSGWFRRTETRQELPDTAVPFPEKDDSLFTAVLSLPDRLRLPVVLYYYHDLTMEDTAKALDITKSTVSRRLKAAENKLRKALETEAAL